MYLQINVDYSENASFLNKILRRLSDRKKLSDEIDLTNENNRSLSLHLADAKKVVLWS